jgi:hypothetical protein
MYRRKPKKLFAGDSKDIKKLQNEIREIEQHLVSNGEEITVAFGDSNIKEARTLTTKCTLYLQSYFKLSSALTTLYETKISKLENQEESPISMTQREQINKEMKEMETICCLGLKGSKCDVGSTLEKNIFGDLLEQFEEKCPLIFNVLQTLLVTDSTKRVHKTPEYKLTCGVNAQAVLLSICNRKCNNDIRLVLGLVCITYGAGKQFINLLNAVGLTPHWDTLYVLYIHWILNTFPHGIWYSSV